jgi:hypothetical protein
VNGTTAIECLQLMGSIIGTTMLKTLKVTQMSQRNQLDFATDIFCFGQKSECGG